MQRHSSSGNQAPFDGADDAVAAALAASALAGLVPGVTIDASSLGGGGSSTTSTSTSTSSAAAGEGGSASAIAKRNRKGSDSSSNSGGGGGAGVDGNEGTLDPSPLCMELLKVGPVVGRGFYGDVYKVERVDTHQTLVLKVLRRQDKGSRAAFLKEAALLRTLRHPNVLRCEGVFTQEGRVRLLTEYCAGGTLARLVQDPKTPLPWARRVRVAADVAKAMDYLHSRRVVHRDLTSENCLLRASGEAVVADFGLARILTADKMMAPPSFLTTRSLGSNGSGGAAAALVAEEEGEGEEDSLAAANRARTGSVTRRLTVVGNPFWMAPEMIRHEHYTAKVDVYSFGILLCELMGRVAADPDELPRSAAFGIDWEKFGPLVPVECPRALWSLAVQCCALEPSVRPNFSACGHALNNLLSEGESEGGVDGNRSSGMLQTRREHLPMEAFALDRDYV